MATATAIEFMRSDRSQVRRVNRHLDERLEQNISTLSRDQSRQRMNRDLQMRTMRESLMREAIMERMLEREHLRLSGLTILAKIVNKDKAESGEVVVAHEEEMSPAQREEFDRQKKVLSNMGKLLRNYTESESTKIRGQMAKKDRRGSIEEEVAEELRQQERGNRSLSQMMGLRRAKTAGPRLVNMRRIEELARPRSVTFQPKTQVRIAKSRLRKQLFGETLRPSYTLNDPFADLTFRAPTGGSASGALGGSHAQSDLVRARKAKVDEANRRLDRRVRQFCSRVDEFNRVNREGTTLDGSMSSRGGSAAAGGRQFDYYGAPMSDAERALATRTPRSRFAGPALMTPSATEITIVI